MANLMTTPETENTLPWDGMSEEERDRWHEELHEKYKDVPIPEGEYWVRLR